MGEMIPSILPAKRRLVSISLIFRQFHGLLLILAVAFTALPSAPAQGVSGTVTQEIELVPGWNAVWIEVDPANRDPGTVFAGIPFEQVWCYFPTGRPVEFIDDPEAIDFNADGWSVYLPPGDPNADLSDLAAIQPCRPYLVKLGGASPVTLAITGKPACKEFDWVPDSFNLVGFPVDPVIGGGGSGSFFFNDDALKNGEKFRLTPDGSWVPLTVTDGIRKGAAYWIQAESETSFSGSLSVETTGLEGGLDFGAGGERRQLVIENHAAWPVSVSVDNADGFPLLRHEIDPIGNTVWIPLDSLFFTLGAEQSVLVRTGVDRTSVIGETSGTLKISGGGSEITIPLFVSRSTDSLSGGGYAGLWVGSATLDKVTETGTFDPSQPAASIKSTPASLDQKLIIHVDAGGMARLLKSVIALWQDGELASDGSVASPGRYVLVTDDARIPDFKGATLRDGRPFGLRISSAAYDFDGNELAMTGGFGAGGPLDTTILVSKESPTHPYRHKFHPDHNGLTPEFDAHLADDLPPNEQELWDINRSISLAFNPASTELRPGGTDTVSGLYTETVTGMHKHPLTATGTFTLQRVSDINSLNPSAY